MVSDLAGIVFSFRIEASMVLKLSFTGLLPETCLLVKKCLSRIAGEEYIALLFLPVLGRLAD